MGHSSTLTSLWSPELYALGMPRIWAACVLLLRQVDYHGHTGRWGSPPALLAARPYFVQRLPACWWVGPDLGTAGYRAQEILGLGLVHW